MPNLTDTKKSTPLEIIITCVVILLPSAVLTAVFYYAIMTYQPSYGKALNWATARLFGCGLGIVFHLSCIILGVFTECRKTVTHRLKEFFSDLPISVSMAFDWYTYDLKTNGAEYWLYLAEIIANICVAVGGLLDYFAIRGIL